VNKARALRLEPNATSPNLVGGEATNSVSSGAAGATVGGGGSAASPNTVSDDFGTISGGQANLAGDNAAPTNSAPGATVGGGGFNVAAQRYATVAGGQENQAIAPWASVGGGYLNVAPGQWATIPGGEENLAPGTHAFAAGYKAQAMLPGTFVWSDDSIAAPFPAMAPQEFSARATGGVRFVSAVNAAGIPTAGVILPPGGNAWLALSDRTAKENVRCVDGREVLEALAGVPMSTWNYQTQDPAIRHMGPMAQDFSAAFGVGEDDTHISTIDADGVALAAIQGLYQIVQEQQQRIRTLEARIAALEGVSGAVRVSSPEAP
jgi:hypothetical protein